MITFGDMYIANVIEVKLIHLLSKHITWDMYITNVMAVKRLPKIKINLNANSCKD